MRTIVLFLVKIAIAIIAHIVTSLTVTISLVFQGIGSSIILCRLQDVNIFL